LFLADKTHLYAISSLVAVCLIIGLNWLLVPRYGAYGAAWATLTAFLVRYLFVYINSQKQYRIDYDWVRIFKLVGICSILYLIRVLVDTSSVVASLAISGAMFILFVVLAAKLILDAEERHALRRFLTKPFHVFTVVGEGRV